MSKLYIAVAFGPGTEPDQFTDEAAARDAATKMVREAGWPRVVVASVVAVYDKRVEISVTDADKP
jgi:hypothetical protein